jgi:hypothetical protein
VIACLGMETSMFLRLCSRAPLILMYFCMGTSYTITEQERIS